MFGSEHAYAFISAFYLLAWLILFFTKKTLRWPIFIIGFIYGGAGPIGEFLAIPDYWNPRFIVDFSIKTPFKTWVFGLEDWVGTFAFMGICTWIYESLHFQKYPDKKFKLSARPFFILIGWGLTVLFLMLILYVGIGVKGIKSTNLAVLITCILFYSFNFRYFKMGLYAALIMALAYWLFMAFVFLQLFPDAIHRVWNSKGNSGFYLLGIPLDEVIWAFLSSLFVGPLYRVAFISKNYTGSDDVI